MYTKLANEALMSINDLVASIRNLHSSSFIQYSSLNMIGTNGITTNEKKLENAMDDLQDVATDLESTLFFPSKCCRLSKNH